MIEPHVVIDRRVAHPITLDLPTKRGDLSAAQYSVSGLENEFGIVFKTLLEFIRCCGPDKSEFEKQLEQLQVLPVGIVLVEPDISELQKIDHYATGPRGSYNRPIECFRDWRLAGHCILPDQSAETLSGFLDHAAIDLDSLKELLRLENKFTIPVMERITDG